MVDMISNLLDLMGVRSTAYVGKNLAAPWAMEIEEHTEFARFHLVLSGSTWISHSDTNRREQLYKGDFAFVPDGRSHILSDETCRQERTNDVIPHVDIEPNFQTLHQDDAYTHVLCGYVQISENAPPVLASLLPDLLIGRAGVGHQSEKIALITKLIGHELSHQSGPEPLVLNRLTEILCLITIRNWLDQKISLNEQLEALSDQRLRLVLDQIHASPSDPWTVESLARIYGQSRTAFAVRFRSAMGISPINYVTSWRMQIARKLLNNSNLPLDEIALRSGYVDTNAFSRAFRREIGTPPAAFRRVVRR